MIDFLVNKNKMLKKIVPILLSGFLLLPSCRSLQNKKPSLSFQKQAELLETNSYCQPDFSSKKFIFSKHPSVSIQGNFNSVDCKKISNILSSLSPKLKKAAKKFIIYTADEYSKLKDFYGNDNLPRLAHFDDSDMSIHLPKKSIKISTVAHEEAHALYNLLDKKRFGDFTKITYEFEKFKYFNKLGEEFDFIDKFTGEEKDYVCDTCDLKDTFEHSVARLDYKNVREFAKIRKGIKNYTNGFNYKWQNIMGEKFESASKKYIDFYGYWKTKSDEGASSYGPDFGFACSFGAKHLSEDIAWFVGSVYESSDFYRELVNSKNKYHKIYRGKLDLLANLGFITKEDLNKTKKFHD